MSLFTTAVFLHGADDLRLSEVDASPPGPGEVAVRVTRAGIGPQEIDYYRTGHASNRPITTPLIAGTEIAGTIAAVGTGVTHLRVGDRVVVNPQHSCGRCDSCRDGRSFECSSLRWRGSAEYFPPVAGGFRQMMTCSALEAVPTGTDMAPERAAFATPLAHALHAMRVAGTLAGTTAAIVGAGSTGLITLLAARFCGVRRLVVFDREARALALAKRIGADQTVELSDPLPISASSSDPAPPFDLVFETTWHEGPVLTARSRLREGGRIIRMVNPARDPAPEPDLKATGFDQRYALRFVDEFDWAVEILSKRTLDVTPLLGAAIPFRNARAGFDLAADETAATKVQLVFD